MTDRELIEAGMTWLRESKHPEGALMQHHGIFARLLERSDLSVSLVPMGNADQPILCIETPLDADSLHRSLTSNEKEFFDSIPDVEQAVAWESNRGRSYPLALTVSPDVRLLVETYRKGCPTHPAESVFCKCGWFANGRGLVVMPEGWL